MENNHIVQLAEAFCEKHKVNEFPVNVISICNKLGISVFEQHLPPAVSGFIVVQEEPFRDFGTGSLIVVNAADSPGRKRFTIAHELAHFELHREEGALFAHRDAGQNGGIETEANIFASNLLMPEALVRKFLSIFDDIPDDYRIQDVSRAFAVSKEAALVRLSQLGLIGG